MKDLTEIEVKRVASLRLFLIAALLLAAEAGIEKVQYAWGVGSILGKFSGSRLMLSAPAFLLAFLAGLGVWWTFDRPQRCLAWGQALLDRLAPLGWLNGVIFAALALVYPLLRFYSVLTPLLKFFNELFIFGCLVLLGAVFLRATGRVSIQDNSVSPARLKLGDWAGPIIQCLVVSLLVYGTVYQVALYLPDTGRESGITNYPLSLNGYSEASRYYLASLFFSKSVYGFRTALPVLHTSRYLLQSIPFIIPSLPIWVHRLWQVLLWMGFTGAGAALLARRLRLSHKLLTLLVTAWAFLFFFQGPIYYHLMACALLVLWGFDRQKFWRSALVVTIASVWAGISRINWFPMPAMIACVLYLMEEPSEGKTLAGYWFKPAAWSVAGLFFSFLTDRLYRLISGNPGYVFGSSFTSSLLPYRLWPNATYGPGIVLALAFTIFPAVWLILAKLIPGRAAWNPLRWLGIGAILGILLAGDLVVSIKIGGGSNLHNLDSFLLMLALVSVYLLFDRMAPDRPERLTPFKPSWVLLGLVLVVPVVSVVTPNVSLVKRPTAGIAQGLATLQSVIDQVTPQGKDILFISERQLITFHDVHGVRLIPAYEMTFLMEMAMADNQRYLQGFYTDLRNHRFSMIVTYPVGETIQGENNIFSEENNAYVIHISQPLLAYYRPEMTIPALDLQILVPR